MSGAKGIAVLHHLPIFRQFFHFHKNLSSSVICGRSPANKAAKVKANEPAFEMYALHSERDHKGDNVAKDLWQGIQITEANLYPPTLVSLTITGLSELLHLRVPKHSETILTCIYGQWEVPSTNRASEGGTEC